MPCPSFLTMSIDLGNKVNLIFVLYSIEYTSRFFCKSLGCFHVRFTQRPNYFGIGGCTFDVITFYLFTLLTYLAPLLLLQRNKQGISIMCGTLAY